MRTEGEAATEEPELSIHDFLPRIEEPGDTSTQFVTSKQTEMDSEADDPYGEPSVGEELEELELHFAVQEADTPALEPESYSGTVHVIFTPAAAAATLSFFWEVLQIVVWVAQVTEYIPLEDGSGYQFTLDLGSNVLVLDRLRDEVPEAEFVELGPNSFRVQLAPPED